MSDLLEKLKKSAARGLEKELEERMAPILEVMSQMLSELKTTNKLLKEILGELRSGSKRALKEDRV